MQAVLVTPITVFPVTLNEAKAHCRIVGDDEDTLLASLIAAATDTVAEQIGLRLGEETWAWTIPRPTSRTLWMPKAPVRAITEIAYFDVDGTAQTEVLADFRLYADGERPFLKPLADNDWPITEDREDAITISFTAGMQNVPAAIKTAIVLLVGHWFENREAVIVGQGAAEMPMAVQHLLGLYRVGWAAA